MAWGLAASRIAAQRTLEAVAGDQQSFPSLDSGPEIEPHIYASRLSQKRHIMRGYCQILRRFHRNCAPVHFLPSVIVLWQPTHRASAIVMGNPHDRT
jgi:hypothetical protein